MENNLSLANDAVLMSLPKEILAAVVSNLPSRDHGTLAAAGFTKDSLVEGAESAVASVLRKPGLCSIRVAPKFSQLQAGVRLRLVELEAVAALLAVAEP